MLASRAVVWRLNAAAVPFVAKSYDIKSAFHSGRLDDLDECVQTKLLPSEVADREWSTSAFFCQYRNNMVMLAAAQERDVALRLGMGGTMGSCIEVRLFMTNFYRALFEYNAKTASAIAAPLRGSHPVTNADVDLSLGMFIDDLLRLIALDAPSDGVRFSNLDATELDKSIRPWRYAQNRGKAEIVANLRSVAHTRNCFESDLLVGRPLAEFLQLGAFLAQPVQTSLKEMPA